MSPPIRDGSGSSIGSIRLGDGSEISEVRTGAGDVLFSAGQLPNSVVTRSADINTFDTTERFGVMFNSTKSFTAMGFEISQKVSGFDTAYLGKFSSNSVITSKSVASLSAGDTFTITASIPANTDLFIALDNSGSSYTVGEDRAADTPTTGSNGVLTIKGRYDERSGGTFTTGKAANIRSVGDIGF